MGWVRYSEGEGDGRENEMMEHIALYVALFVALSVALFVAFATKF